MYIVPIKHGKHLKNHIKKTCFFHNSKFLFFNNLIDFKIIRVLYFKWISKNTFTFIVNSNHFIAQTKQLDN